MELQQHEQLLDQDDIIITQEELIHNDNISETDKDTSYHKLPSLESIIVNTNPDSEPQNNDSNTALNTHNPHTPTLHTPHIHISPTNNTHTLRPLIRYGNELLISHCDMSPISIAIVGDSQEYVTRLCHMISTGRNLSNAELQSLPSNITNHSVQCPYRTRLIPITLHCFYDSDIDTLTHKIDCPINVWIICVSPENNDINSWYTKYHGQWNNIITTNYPKSRRIIACVQCVDQLDDDSSSYHLPNNEIKVKHVALYSMSSVYELFEKAIGVALDDNFCQIMKSKYTQYCVRNIKYANYLWNCVELISPWIWSLNLVFNMVLIAYAFIFKQYTFAVLFSCIFLLLNILLTYQFVKIYCRSDNIDATKLVVIFVIGFLFGFLIPLFAYLHYHCKSIRHKLVAFIRTDIDESSLNDFSANVPIRPSCWGFAIHSITFTLPFTFLQVLMMILGKNNDGNRWLIVILFVNMCTLMVNSWCLIFTRTDKYAFIFAWICVVLDTFSGVLSILLTFYIDTNSEEYNVIQFLHKCWWVKIYVCGMLSLGFEFLNIAESWEHITSGFFELLDHFRSYVSPIPRFQCIGAILAIIFISLGGLIIFFIFQTLGMIIFMFALYFLNWSWCLSLLDDQVMHEFDELYSSLIHFILSAHNKSDYALRLSVVNYELNPFTKKMKHVNYELLDMIHLQPKDWLFHGKKYFSEHFLWGAIGGYHYQKEKWLDLREEYSSQNQNQNQNKLPCTEKFPRLFWIGFFGCSAYIFQPLYTFVILFSNLYPLIVYVSYLWIKMAHIPTVIHIMMAVYVILIPMFAFYVKRASKFAFTLFHIVSARKKLYKRPRQLFEAQDSMKFFARVWKHYIYVHVTLLRNQMVEEYFGDLYKEVLSLLSPLQRMDNLIELYEEMYSDHCGRVNIKFADFVVMDDTLEKDNKCEINNIVRTAPSPVRVSRNGRHRHRHRHGHRSSVNRTHTMHSSHSHRSGNSRRQSRKHSSVGHAHTHHNALLYDAEHKRRRRLRKTKKTLLLDRSLIDLIDGGNNNTNEENEEIMTDDMMLQLCDDKNESDASESMQEIIEAEDNLGVSLEIEQKMKNNNQKNIHKQPRLRSASSSFF